MPEMSSVRMLVRNVSSITIVILLVVSTTQLADAQQQKVVCVLAPIDQTINSNNLATAFSVIAEHNQTAKYVGLITELTDKTNAIKGCDVVLQFQRMNNVNEINNLNVGITHYNISGNVITLFTNTTPVQLNLGASGGGSISPTAKGGEVFALPMTNYACLGLAFGSYHQSIGSTSSTYCNPYATSSTTHNPNHEVPIYIVHKSLESAFAKLHV